MEIAISMKIQNFYLQKAFDQDPYYFHSKTAKDFECHVCMY